MVDSMQCQLKETVCATVVLLNWQIDAFQGFCCTLFGINENQLRATTVIILARDMCAILHVCV